MLFARLILRQLAVVAIALASVFLGPLAATTAHAEPPMNLPEQMQIHDPAQVLSDGDRAKLQAEIDKLYADHGVSMWVVYVKSFDDMPAEKWADVVRNQSDLTDRDVLLAVATDSRRYYLSTPEVLDKDKIDDIAKKDVEPRLKKGEWSAAGIGAVRGIDKALSSSHVLAYTAAGVGGTAALAGGGAYLYTRRRREQEAKERLESLRSVSDELTVDQLASQSIDDLDDWSREILTDTDNAVRTSAEELSLAVDEFGEAQTKPFRDAVESAQKGIADSFVLRQRLDDAIEENPDEQRSMLVQIITTCHDIDASLDDQVQQFDEMRNLLLGAPERLDGLTRSIVDLKTRATAAEGMLASLIAKHGEDRVKAVSHNVELAEKQIDFAEENVDDGRDATAAPAGKQGAVVAAIRAAEGAVAQAGKLLDAVANADTAIAEAATRLPVLIDEVTAEIAAAGKLDSSPTLADAVADAQAALDYAAANTDSDPLGSFTTLTETDAVLDRELAAARKSTSKRKRGVELREQTIAAAESKVSAARDFIDTRRGAVQAEARTRLTEAQRLVESAHARPAKEAAEAVEDARRAGALADEALMNAQDDVVAWQQTEQPAEHGGDASAIGAVLSGVLVDSFLRGGLTDGGRSGGGYTYDGRSPGSYGGSSSSGRIGTGGRF
ncbi:TPM domain-containing protein [Gordonia sp. (in: high G+C Gram-positive bacteria)]|uniref:TPM domain-containing protein n=1 Tax=Gordonia sp. (in: high G+C Gram-positive bacteria) TaxID=84139 RepID=UPI0039E331F2